MLIGKGAFRLKASHFLLLAPKKVAKEEGTPSITAFGSPVLLNQSSGCGTRFAQTVLAENSRLTCVARREKGKYKQHLSIK